MSYTMTVKSNHFCTILHYSFFSFCVAKVAPRHSIFIYFIHFLVFFLHISLSFLLNVTNRMIRSTIRPKMSLLTKCHPPIISETLLPLPVPLHCRPRVPCCGASRRLNTPRRVTAAPGAGSRLQHGHRFGSSDPATALYAPISLRRKHGHEDSKGGSCALTAPLVWTIRRSML